MPEREREERNKDRYIERIKNNRPLKLTAHTPTFFSFCTNTNSCYLTSSIIDKKKKKRWKRNTQWFRKKATHGPMEIEKKKKRNSSFDTTSLPLVVSCSWLQIYNDSKVILHSISLLFNLEHVLCQILSLRRAA
jgi:hypothetical protein